MSSIRKFSCILGLLVTAKVPAAENPLLRYVPADTPYVVANTEGFSTALQDEFMGQMRPMLDAFASDEWLSMVVPVVDEQQKDALVPLRLMAAMMKETGGQTAAQLREKWGLNEALYQVFYGQGALPVWRIELADAKRFTQAFDQLIKNVGGDPAKTKLGMFSLREFGSKDDPAQIVGAIADDQFVLTFFPQNASPALRAQILSSKLPSKHLLQKTLTDLDTANGYNGFATGFVDLVRLTTLLVDRRGATEQAMAKALKIDDIPTSAACKRDFISIAKNMPSVVFGYTELTAQRLSMSSRLNLRADLAKKLQDMSVATPLLGENQSMFRFSMAVDPVKFVAFLGEQADAILKNPYTCESLLSWNESAKKMQEQASNPMLGMAANAQGFSIVLNTLTFDEKNEPKTLDGLFALHSNQPAALWAMFAAFSPELQKIKLIAGAPPVMVEAPAATKVPGKLAAIMADAWVGLAVGQDPQKNLVAEKLKTMRTNKPFFTETISGEAYRLLGRMNQFAMDAAQKSVASEDEKLDEQALKTKQNLAKMQASVSKVYDAFADRLDNIKIEAEFTDQGVVAKSWQSMKPLKK
jgi:hypothetical protein